MLAGESIKAKHGRDQQEAHDVCEEGTGELVWPDQEEASPIRSQLFHFESKALRNHEELRRGGHRQVDQCWGSVRRPGQRPS